jgi:hypothetical protein
LDEQDSLYTVEIATQDKDGNRCKRNLSVLQPHEVLEDQWSNPEWREALDARIEAGSMPEVYLQHPVVLANESDEPVCPVSIFIDGVPYSHTDSVIGFWIIDEILLTRHLICALRKSVCCSCGCRGWCTIQMVFRWLVWSLVSMASGVYPPLRHDNCPYDPTDVKRSGLAGTPLARKSCVMYVKADWAELSGTFGLAAWNDGLRPCPKCNASPDALFRVAGMSPAGTPWVLNTHEDYDAACTRCEIVVRLDAATHQAILALLRYDRRDHGSRGRALTAAAPALQLLAGDRLVESDDLLDVGDFDSLFAFPVTVKFWRRSNETIARNRNPLLNAAIGVTLASLTGDVLHVLYLGVMQVYCRRVVWLLLTCGAWGIHSTMSQTIASGMIVCRQSLANFYTRRHGTYPREKLTRISNLSKKHLGDNSDRACKLKGAQTWGFFLFLLDMLRPRAGALGSEAQKLLRAGEALLTMVSTWRAAGPRLSVTKLQLAVDCWSTFCRLTAEFEDMLIPKRHMMSHLVVSATWFGNPNLYSNFEDESLNKPLKASCRTVSQVTFEPFLLLKFKILLQKRGVNRT